MRCNIQCQFNEPIVKIYWDSYINCFDHNFTKSLEKIFKRYILLRYLLCAVPFVELKCFENIFPSRTLDEPLDL